MLVVTVPEEASRKKDAQGTFDWYLRLRPRGFVQSLGRRTKRERKREKSKDKGKQRGRREELHAKEERAIRRIQRASRLEEATKSAKGGEKRIGTSVRYKNKSINAVITDNNNRESIQNVN